jgi:predicted rRNA methylase YqxC with S4 and FtsJ domains
MNISLHVLNEEVVVGHTISMREASRVVGIEFGDQELSVQLRMKQSRLNARETAPFPHLTSCFMKSSSNLTIYKVFCFISDIPTALQLLNDLN